MSMIEEFKKFAFKGNVVDLAVGVIIGAAFGKIVTGLVENIIMPVIGSVMPSPDWKTAAIPLREIKNDKGEIVMAKITYGAFLGTVVDFVIIALVLFMIVTFINKVQKKKEEAPAPPTPSEALLAEIRDLLKKPA
ncbi:MAG: large-conductance mechanosensitive channel protein MscL [Polyangiaceae bacterium]